MHKKINSLFKEKKIQKNIIIYSICFQAISILLSEVSRSHNLIRVSHSPTMGDVPERLDSFTIHYYLDSGYSSMSESTWSLTAIMLSSASASLPYACSDLGPLFTVVLFAACALASWFSGRILIMLADTRRDFHVDSFVLEACGAVLSWVFLVLACSFAVFAIALNLRQASLAILASLPVDFISKNFFSLLPADIAPSFQLSAVVLVVSIVTIPFVRFFNTLPSVSSLSFLSVVCFTLTIPCFLSDIKFDSIQPGNDDDNGGSNDTPGSAGLWNKMMAIIKPHNYRAVGTVLYTFGTAFNCLTIYNNLRMRKIERGLAVVKSSITLCFALLVCFTVTGFLAYVPEYSSSVRLSVFDERIAGHGLAFARVLYFLFEFFKFPADLMIAKVAIRRLRKRLQKWRRRQSQSRTSITSSRGSKSSLRQGKISENSSTRLSHDIQQAREGLESILTAPLVSGNGGGGGDNAQQRTYSCDTNSNAGMKYDEEFEHRARRKISAESFGAWITAIIISIAPRASRFIVMLGAPSATLLGFIFPALSYMKLGPVNSDFADVACFRRTVPNQVFCACTIMFGVIAWFISVVGGINSFHG